MSIGHNGTVESAGNWIAVSRDIRDHPIVGFGQPVKPADPKRGSYSRTEAWLDLIMEARWQPGQINNKGKVVQLCRGQLMAARAWLASRWNWTENAVRWFLDKLEKEVMIRRNHHHSNPKERRHYANVLTIEKYDIFQTAAELLSLLPPKQTTNQPPINHQSPTIQPPESNKGTREQEREASSLRSEGPDVPGIETAKEIIWGKGLDWLKKNSFVKNEVKLRVRLGGWVKDYGDEAVLEAMRSAQKAKPGEPMSWMEKILRENDRADQHVKRQGGRLEVFNGFQAELSQILDGRDLRRSLDRIGGKIPVHVTGVELESRVRALAIELVDQTQDQDRRYAAASSKKQHGERVF